MTNQNYIYDMNIRLNTLHIRMIAKALRELVSGLRIDRISGGRGNFVLFLGDGGLSEERRGGSLHFRKDGDVSLTWFSSSYPEIGDTPWNPPVKGELIENISAVDNDRIIQFVLSEHTLYAELTGRRANIVCTDKGQRIITALTPVDRDKSRHRQILKGIKYSLPPRMQRICPSQADSDQIEAWIANPQEAARESTVSSLLFWSLLAEKDNPEEILKVAMEENPSVTFYRGEIFPFKVDGGAVYPDILECIADAIGDSAQAVDLGPIFLQIERARKRKHALEKELADWKPPEHYQHIADTLNANHYRLNKGSDSIVLPDVYSPDMMLNIDLKRNKSIGDNVRHYYEMVKRAESATKNIPIYIKEVEERLHRLHQLLEDPQKAKVHLEKRVPKPSGKEEESRYYRTLNYLGYEILVGKSAAGNDYLTLRVAKPWDIWLHARNVPGSHVIVRLPDKKEPPANVLIMAAQVAAFYSNLKHQSGAEVIWTYRKWVQKVRKKQGAVKLIKDFTLMVDPATEKNLNIMKKKS